MTFHVLVFHGWTCTYTGKVFLFINWAPGDLILSKACSLENIPMLFFVILFHILFYVVKDECNHMRYLVFGDDIFLIPILYNN